MKKLVFGLLVILLLLLAGLMYLRGNESLPEQPTTQPTTQPITQPTTQPTAPPTTPPTTAPTVPAAPEANPYGPEDFALQNGYMVCTAADSMLGIDVSAYQQDIDWQAVRAAGVEFVMLRVGFRGYGSTGSLNADSAFLSHYAGAREAGLKIGAYFFSQAITAEEAAEEAAFALSLVDGLTLELPIAYDWEYIRETARTGNMDAAGVTDCAIAFCEAIRQAGYTPMLYSSEGQSYLELERLGAYPLWAACYGEMTYPWKLQLWQYTNTGTVAGIAGNVDLNVLLKN